MDDDWQFHAGSRPPSAFDAPLPGLLEGLAGNAAAFEHTERQAELQQ